MQAFPGRNLPNLRLILPQRRKDNGIVPLVVEMLVPYVMWPSSFICKTAACNTQGLCLCPYFCVFICLLSSFVHLSHELLYSYPVKNHVFWSPRRLSCRLCLVRAGDNVRLQRRVRYPRTGQLLRRCFRLQCENEPSE